MIELYPHQADAIPRMKNGCILCGGVGSGKSRAALSYYYCQMGGDVNSEEYSYMTNPRDLYIITTSQKRDKREWVDELIDFHMSPYEDLNEYTNKIVIDSWNNIKKYRKVFNAFFIFDEQRVVGNGAWTKAFLDIARKNKWILLSATPGDKWEDYIPVFVANGFYKNKTEFCREHLIYSQFTNYPKVTGYRNTGRLIKYRRDILVPMEFERPTNRHEIEISCSYDLFEYKMLVRNRWNSEKGAPIDTAAELCFLLRKIVNSDPSRIHNVEEIVAQRKRCIIFYNYDYELEILRNGQYGDAVVAEWNGHNHDPIPNANSWIYLVQYTAGCEGWNCIKTDTIIFYSQNYSYKVMVQASGRIDRANTPFIDLYYYHLVSKSPIDLGIKDALKKKKKFNEDAFFRKM